MTGWGKDAFVGGNYQQVLKEVELPVVADGVCENMLRRTRLGPGFALHDGFLCAGGEEGKDACKVTVRAHQQLSGPKAPVQCGFQGVCKSCALESIAANVAVV